MYIGGDVPMCVECSDAQQAKHNPPEAEQHIRAALLQDILEATALNNEATREFETTMGQIPNSSAHPALGRQVQACLQQAIHRQKKIDDSAQPHL